MGVAGWVTWAGCGCTAGRIHPDGNGRGEPIATPVERLDAVLAAAIVADGLANRHQALRQNALTDEAVGPQVLQELLLGDDALAMLEEVGEDI
jgi:hypothetical protein